ncbi:hypothetical protein M8818_005438 [Zalaria obscura]|uniref:Uncharacterized protein n=1 Tax=Zalaria obscura TaxID=2024903 RepID=A0ACC3S8W7_9PEZI
MAGIENVVIGHLNDRERLAMSFQCNLEAVKEMQLSGTPQGEIEVMLRGALDNLKTEFLALGEDNVNAFDERDIYTELAEALKGPQSTESAHQGTEVETIAKGRQETKRAKTEENTPTTNALATLDMIITIVGEFYGQKDLLELRPRWDRSGL